MASSSSRTPPRPDQPNPDVLRCLGGRLAINLLWLHLWLFIGQQFVDLAIAAHRAIEGFVDGLDLLVQDRLRVGDHLPQGLARAGIRLVARIADARHAVGLGEIIRRRRRTRPAIGFAIDFKQSAAGLLDLALMMLEALGEPRAS